MQLPLPICSYRLPSPAASSERLVNCYAEPAPKGSPKQRAILRRAPGLREWVEVGDGPIRGFSVMNGLLYALSGDELYEITEAASETLLTGSVPGAERVRMENNGTNLAIVRPFDNSGYAYSGSSVAQIVDSTFTGWGASEVAFVDGYLVFLRPGTQQFFHTAVNSLTFNALNITSADGAPDKLRGMIADHRELVLGGFDTSELWYNAGLPTGSVFARSPNGFLEIGLGAPYGMGKQDGSVLWLANDKTFRRLQSRPEKISQYGVDALVERLSKTDDCFALPYTLEGHLQIAFTFPFAGRTIVFDCSTGEWHDRESYGLGRWRANCVVNFAGMQLAGDSETGKIGVIDPDTHEEFGSPQRVEWIYQAVYAERNRASHRRFELVLNTGEGVTTGQGQNPLATLKISDDSGNTWRTLPTRSLGEIGKYKTTAAWWNMGSAKERVYKVEITDPVPLYIADTQIEVDGGRL